MNDGHVAMADDVNPLVTAAKLESHEKVCSERYGEIKGSFARIHGRLDKIMYAVIALLITMVGWLIVNGVPWK